MLRLETCEVGTGGEEGARPALTPQAIGSVVSELHAADCPTFAIDRLCAALVSDQPRQARAQVDRLLDCGVAVEALVDSYIPRTAARLGEMWVEDTFGFAAVTLGMARLTEIYRALSPTYLRNRGRRTRRRRALFALAPGETHALGVVMAADRFERAGWAVRVELQADAGGLARLARGHRFDLIGVSAACRRMIPAVTDAVAALRNAAGGTTPILVGGHLRVLEEDIAGITGADGAHACASMALVEQEGARTR